MSTKSWIIFVAICVLLFGGLIIWSQRDRIDVSNVNTNDILSARATSGDIGDHVDGNKDAKVVLIEYGDFQCPGCGKAHPVVKSVMEKYGSDVAFVFRNFPLTSIHPNARAAAAAAEAAGLEGGKEKYWQMHDQLYQNQQEWQDASTSERTSLFAGYAQAIGLDKSKFESRLSESSSRINQKISFDQELGRKLDITGTPTFYLNGKLMTSEQFGSEEAFATAIEAELKEQGVELPKSSDEE